MSTFLLTVLSHRKQRSNHVMLEHVPGLCFWGEMRSKQALGLTAISEMPIPA
jgi:hypothetical protein